MPSDMPIQFRAIHEKTRWRKARHESLHNAIFGTRGALALFEGRNAAINLSTHGNALYVVAWDERTEEDGALVKRDPAESQGIRSLTLPKQVILDWESRGGPEIEEVESWFREPETLEKLNTLLQREISRSMASSSEDRRRRLATANPIPERVTVSTTAFRRNADVIAEVLERANGVCERCGSPAPFAKISGGAPYLEVHHKIPLAKGGHDTVSNAEALCPNCHRNKHFGPESTAL
jgi:5-methylcytosine-specific restriction endonuclease McrA